MTIPPSENTRIVGAPIHTHGRDGAFVRMVEEMKDLIEENRTIEERYASPKDENSPERR